VLGTDGSLHVIDPASARLLRSIPVVEPWEEPMEWQEPRPAVTVLEGMAYVTDPSANALHVVDVVTGEVWESTDLPVTPNEVLGVTG
jgi:DNA-binding beta-propeller fold protein YncE